MPFLDSLEPERLEKSIAGWQKPGCLYSMSDSIPGFRKGFAGEFQELKVGLNSGSLGRKTSLEKAIISWLYGLIRLNVKRGRVFDLREVFQSGRADCLGYAKLFTTFGRACGLDMGVVEVIVDNRGRRVPHTASLIRLSNGQKRIVDFWYGSQNIRHLRLGLRVKRGLNWYIEDINYGDFSKVEDISFLPDSCVDAITLYILGNRCLKNKDYSQAVSYYSQAIDLYPENARAFYNRAIAFENLGQSQKAQIDYARALKEETALIRTLAIQPEDVVDLIGLDEKQISENEQCLYLLHEGYITGKKLPPSAISRRIKIPISEVKMILESLRTRLSS